MRGLSILLIVALSASLTAFSQNNGGVRETRPEFPGGFGAFKSYLATEFKYPESAKKLKFQGVLEFRMLIEADGSGTLFSGPDFSKMQFNTTPKTEDEQYLNEMEGDVTKEVIRLIDEMHPWKPATRNGQAMKVFINVPLRLALY